MNLAVIPMIPITLTALIGIITIPILFLASIPIALFVFGTAICGCIAVVVFGLFSMFVISPVLLAVAAIVWTCVIAYRSCKLVFVIIFGLVVDRLWPPGPLPDRLG